MSLRLVYKWLDMWKLQKMRVWLKHILILLFWLFYIRCPSSYGVFGGFCSSSCVCSSPYTCSQNQNGICGYFFFHDFYDNGCTFLYILDVHLVMVIMVNFVHRAVVARHQVRFVLEVLACKFSKKSVFLYLLPINVFIFLAVKAHKLGLAPLVVRIF